MNKILTLWDIDGNLVNVYKYHTPAYQNAIKQVYGVKPTFEEIEKNYGLPASEVVSIPVRNLGISEKIIQKNIEEVFLKYSQYLEKGIKTASKESKVILPGITEFLIRLQSLNIPRGIVTGNIKRAGEAIIKGASLLEYFDSKINSYGDNCTNRYKIVAAAINNAKKNKIIDQNTRIYVFGDTPADIEAANKNNCISIAVIKNSNDADSSPGGNSYRIRKEALKKAKPDFLIDDYTHTDDILSMIGITK